ncbi:MAG: hypothetical protein J1F10_00895, partial [Muribaculaceae bacterium]|nr:hypothetical protein [Muribaculaceae bacterium]
MKSILKFLVFAFFLYIPSVVNAEEESYYPNKFSLGIENNRLIFGQYTYKDHFTAKLNVSAYSEKLSFQYARATLGYKTSLNLFLLEGKYFFGSAFNGSYYNTGVILNARAKLVRRLLVGATIAPWFDSGYKYNTCWNAEVGCVITRHIDIKLGYTTLPEYRMSENRIIGG